MAPPINCLSTARLKFNDSFDFLKIKIHAGYIFKTVHTDGRILSSKTRALSATHHFKKDSRSVYVKVNELFFNNFLKY